MRDPVRLETFSDGVFAIAITLLILEIDIPAAEDIAGEHTLMRALFDLWPSYFGYLVSFLVIGILWINHHNIFKFVDAVDHWLLTINLVLLLCIAFIPFPTALLAEHIADSDEQTASVFYALVFFVTSCVFYALWWYPTQRAPWLLEPNVDQVTIDMISRRYMIGPLAYLFAATVSWFSPTIGLILLSLIALLYLAPTRWADPVEREPV